MYQFKFKIIVWVTLKSVFYNKVCIFSPYVWHFLNDFIFRPTLLIQDSWFLIFFSSLKMWHPGFFLAGTWRIRCQSVHSVYLHFQMTASLANSFGSFAQPDSTAVHLIYVLGTINSIFLSLLLSSEDRLPDTIRPSFQANTVCLRRIRGPRA